VVQQVPTMLNFGDPIHHLNLTIKDITELQEFQEVHSHCSFLKTQANVIHIE